MIEEIATEYAHTSSEASHTHAYLWEPVMQEITNFAQLVASTEKRIFDLGCGNGSFARHAKDLGYHVTGVDPSDRGIELARTADQSIAFGCGQRL